VLREVFPDTWQEIFNLACFFLSRGEPMMYAQDWLSQTEGLSGNLDSQEVSKLLRSLGQGEQEQFFAAWGACRSEREYLALDITSISSYSHFIDDLEWGYNRDGENLKQINLCLLSGETSRLPVFQAICQGSIRDVNTLKTTIEKACGIGKNRLTLVMDKGFFSRKNLDSLLEGPLKSKFLISVPFTLKAAVEAAARLKQTIDIPENTLEDRDMLRGLTERCPWDDEHRLFMHVYFNSIKAAEAKNRVYGQVSKLLALARSDPENPDHADAFKRYLSIKKSKTTGKVNVSVRHEAVEQELVHAGWMVLLTNQVKDAQEALRIYRARDAVEKGFLSCKQDLDLRRLRIHSDETMRAKIFVGFIALILKSAIHVVMQEKRLYRDMTMKELIRTLEKLRLQYIAGNRILYPLSKGRKDILSAFAFSPPL
jgi:transposase